MSPRAGNAVTLDIGCAECVREIDEALSYRLDRIERDAITG